MKHFFIFMFFGLFISIAEVSAQERILFKTEITDPHKKTVYVVIKGNYRGWNFFGNKIQLPYTKHVWLRHGKTDVRLKGPGKYSVSYTQHNRNGKIKKTFYIYVSEGETEYITVLDTRDMTVEDFERLRYKEKKKRRKKLNDAGTRFIKGAKELQNWINRSAETIADTLKK